MICSEPHTPHRRAPWGAVATPDNGQSANSNDRYGGGAHAPVHYSGLASARPGLRIEILPWTEHAYDQLASGAVDLVFSPIAAPPPLRVQLLYNEEFVCVLANIHPYKGKTLTIKKYLEFKHVVIETQPGQQTLVDRSLTEGGYRRNIWLQLPYFIPAIAAV
jgi:DNA-binding transcriptional LysR family regulator